MPFMEIVSVIAGALYLFCGFLSWILVGLATKPTDANDLNMLSPPASLSERAAFTVVFIFYLLTWPILLSAGRYAAWQERRAIRATGFNSK